MSYIGNASAGLATSVDSNTVEEGDIQNSAVTTAKIADAAVTSGKLASGAAVSNIGFTPANAASLATVATSGSYTDLSNKPTIPTVPTNVSSFTNDSGYLTSATGVTSVNSATGAVTVQPTLVSGTNIKTVNGTSLLGSGDITAGASTTFNDIGTYCWGQCTSSSAISPGGTVSGSSINQTNATGFSSAGNNTTGTWRCMGYSAGGGGTTERTTLWCRIS